MIQAVLAELLAADASGIARAAELVMTGEVVAFPTDTVYGLMALPSSAEKIYEVKRRPEDKLLIVMAAQIEHLRDLVVISPRSRAYADRYWPGPLTVVLPAAQPGDPSLGVRIPDHPVALALLRAIGTPVVTTSANLSGEPPALTAGEVVLEGVAAVLDGGRAPGGVASTVLRLDGPVPEIVREGAIAASELLDPRGASVGVYRDGPHGRQWLMLHRRKYGPGDESDWAWGPPAGSRLPGEPTAAAARRELEEETGLGAEPIPAGTTGRWDVYLLEVPADWEPRLSAEHDRYEWLPIDEALRRSRPEAARQELRLAAAAAGDQ